MDISDIEAIVRVGKSTVAVACGETLALIDTEDGQLIRNMDRANVDIHPPVMHGLAASPDGTRIVAAGTDRVPRIWDVASGEVVLTLPDHPHWVQACRFTADGSRVITACRDGIGRVFDSATGSLQAKLVGHKGRLWDVVFDQKALPVTVGADGTVRRWASAPEPTMAGLRDLPLTGSGVTAIDELGGGETVPTLLIVETGGSVLTHSGDDVAGCSIPAWSAPDVKSLACDAPRGRMAFGNFFEGKRPVPLVATLSSGTSTDQPVTAPSSRHASGAAVAWTADGCLVTCSHEGQILAWSPSLEKVFEIGQAAPTKSTVAAAPNKPSRFAVCGVGGRVFTLATDGRPVGTPVTLALPASTVSVVRWSPDSRLIACGMREGEVHLCDAASGALIGSLVPQERAIEAIAFTADGRILLTADHDRLRISDTATLRTIDEIVPGWKIGALFVSADGERVFLGGVTHRDHPPGALSRLVTFELDVP